MFEYFNFSEFMKKGFVYNRLTIFTVIFLSVIVSSIVWFASKNYYDNLIKEKFETSVLENINQIDKRMSIYKNVLQSGIGFFHGSDDVSRKEWHDFISTVELKKNYPGIQGIGFSLMLAPDEVAAIEQKMHKEGFDSFKVKPLGKRDQYSSILYLEPLDKRNLQAI